jgi:Protein of unknown function (DUF3082)
MRRSSNHVHLHKPLYSCVLSLVVASILMLGSKTDSKGFAFQTPIATFEVSLSSSSLRTISCTENECRHMMHRSYHLRPCYMLNRHHRLYDSRNDDPDIVTSTNVETSIHENNDKITPSTSTVVPTTAAIGTVNERLLAELQQATAMEKSGTNRYSKNNRLVEVSSFFKSSKTDEERKAAIAEAQNLNGVNPITTLFGAIFAIVCSIGLWYITQSLASYFALHPTTETDMYIIQRVTIVSRNIVMGLIALASGFFGVTGIGILLLAIRVGYGVIIGELDPSPSNYNATNNNIDNNKVNIGKVWDLMLNKSNKKGRR